MLPVPETIETNIEGGGNVMGPIIRAGGDIEEDQSRSGGSQYQEGGGASGEDQDDADADQSRRNKRKRYHRHAQQQIQELEAFFKEWPHPDDKQRKELSTRLGLENLQIKFWFQNKRTQVKVERLSSLLAKQDRGKAPANYPMLTHPDLDLGFQNTTFELQQPAGIGAEMDVHISPSRTPAEDIKHVTVQLADVAMEEIIVMAQAGEPLWVPCSTDGSSSMLREEEYTRTFPRILEPRPAGFKSEGSRKMAVVKMDHLSLIEILMDVVCMSLN